MLGVQDSQGRLHGTREYRFEEEQLRLNLELENIVFTVIRISFASVKLFLKFL